MRLIVYAGGPAGTLILNFFRPDEIDGLCALDWHEPSTRTLLVGITYEDFA